MSAQSKIQEAVDDLLKAQKLVDDLQRELCPAALHSGEKAVIDKSALWHRLESIDDQLHTALGHLGE